MTNLQTIYTTAVQTAVDTILEATAAELAKDKTLFKTPMTKAALLKLFKSGESKSKKDDSSSSSDDAKAVKAALPEGWTDKDVDKLHEGVGKAKDGALWNAFTKRHNGAKKLGSLLVSKTHSLCAAKDKKPEFDALCAWLDENSKGKAAVADGSDSDDSSSSSSDDKKSKKSKDESSSSSSSDAKAPKDDSDDSSESSSSSSSESEVKSTKSKKGDKSKDDASSKGKKDKKESKDDGDYIEGYDMTKLTNLKKALDKAEDGTFVNVSSRKKVQKTPANEKTYVFDEKRKLAVPKVKDDEAATKKAVKAVLKMLE